MNCFLFVHMYVHSQQQLGWHYLFLFTEEIALEVVFPFRARWLQLVSMLAAEAAAEFVDVVVRLLHDRMHDLAKRAAVESLS